MNTLHYATALTLSDAKVVLFGANSNRASHAPSHQTSSAVDRSIFSGDFAREAENESPSLSEKMVLGDHLYDAGNIPMPEKKRAQVKTIFDYYDMLFLQKKIPICLGGDHLVKYAGLSALFKHHPDAYVVYLDAHPDCHMANRLYYGSILHHILNEKLTDPSHIILTGLRQSNAKEKMGYDYYQMPTIFGIDFAMHAINDIAAKIKSLVPQGKPIYFSVDLDGFDPADTPGVEQPCPGGPKVNEFLALMHLLSPAHSFIGMDITEFLPAIDHQKLTALTMTRIVKEFVALTEQNT